MTSTRKAFEPEKQVKAPSPKELAIELYDLAHRIGSRELALEANTVLHQEQKQHRYLIGNVTLRRAEGVWYQKLPTGWEPISSLDDLILQEVTSS